MLVSSSDLNVTYYTNLYETIFPSRVNQRLNRSKLLPAWKKMELISLILAIAPGTTNIHKQCAPLPTEPDVSMHMVPSVRSFILRNCHMDHAITNFHVWSQTIRTQGPKKSQETVSMFPSWCFPWGELDGNWKSEVISTSFWMPRQLFTSSFHPYKSVSTCFKNITLKNSRSPKRFFQSAKTQPVKHQGQCGCMRTWDIGSSNLAPDSEDSGYSVLQDIIFLISNGRRNKSIQQCWGHKLLLTDYVSTMLPSQGDMDNFCWRGGDDVCGAIGSSGPFF